MIKLLANENFPLDSVIYLSKVGYDIKAIGTDHKGVRDTDVLKIAQEEQRLILTFDRDYGELIFKHNYRPEQGVIYLRLQTYESDEHGKIIAHLLSNSLLDLAYTLTVFDGETVRQRKY